jgi:hypothetical protein
MLGQPQMVAWNSLSLVLCITPDAMRQALTRVSDISIGRDEAN